MEEKKTIIDYLAHIFCSFGMTMVIMMIFCKLFGEDANGFSSMFRLGDKGLALETMLQFLLVVIIEEGIRILFFTDGIIKKMSISMRTVCMLLAIVVVIAFFIVKCDWFPVNMWQPWIMFLICFGISFGISTAVVAAREKTENKKMEDGLNRLKKKWEDEENDK